MKLTLISNCPSEIVESQKLGIERIMVDLEFETKIERQKGRDLFLSHHSINDLPVVSNRLNNQELVVRINSINQNTVHEINALSEFDVDYVMLPFFVSMHEIEIFYNLLPPNIKPILLFENYKSIQLAPSILSNYNVNEAYIGLNDLSLSANFNSIFKVFEDDSFYSLVNLFKEYKTPFGFGGVGNMKSSALPINPEMFLMFQLCFGSERGWLSRNFRSIFGTENWEMKFSENVNAIRNHIKKFQNMSDSDKDEIISNFYDRIKSMNRVD